MSSDAGLRRVLMPKLRVHSLSVSLDGYVAGPDQSIDNPLGVGGTQLHDWAFATRTFRQLHAMTGGSEGLDQLDGIADRYAVVDSVGSTPLHMRIARRPT